MLWVVLLEKKGEDGEEGVVGGAMASGARSAQYEHTIVITSNGAEILT